MRFDLLIAGGELLDPASGRHGRFDLGIADGRVAAVEQALPQDAAAEVVDATGLLVTPGLVDLHTHAFPDVTYWGVDADALAPAAGVTTWIDAGSAGAFTIRGFRRFVADRAQVRIKAFLNVSSIGLVAPSWEVASRRYLDEDACLAAVEEHRGDFVIGLKVRIDRFTVGPLGLEPLEVALRLAARAELPLMVHIGHGPPELDPLLGRLRPGDILTHCATAATMAPVVAGRVVPGVREAVERGVVLDVGHGAGAFSFAAAEALLAAGLPPRTISSDVHQHSVNGPMFDLPTCMTKLLALGMPLADVVAAATVEPARAVGLEASLAVGAPADVTLLAREPGPFPIRDVLGERRDAPVRLRAAGAYVSGKRLQPVAVPLPPPWIELTTAQHALRERAARGEAVDPAAELEDVLPLAPLDESDA
jgi:dihydroorotase